MLEKIRKIDEGIHVLQMALKGSFVSKDALENVLRDLQEIDHILKEIGNSDAGASCRTSGVNYNFNTRHS